VLVLFRAEELWHGIRVRVDRFDGDNDPISSLITMNFFSILIITTSRSRGEFWVNAYEQHGASRSIVA
jgi:hypothetical protein